MEKLWLARGCRRATAQVTRRARVQVMGKVMLWGAFGVSTAALKRQERTELDFALKIKSCQGAAPARRSVFVSYGDDCRARENLQQYSVRRPNFAAFS